MWFLRLTLARAARACADLVRAALIRAVFLLAGSSLAAASSGEAVTFEGAAFPPSRSEVARAGEEGRSLVPRPGITITGHLYRPAGKGPFPAVVLMHGCRGIGRWNSLWRRRLVDWGYVVFDIDSFGPRGLEGGICSRTSAAGPIARALDAFGAKSHLVALPFVARDRIGVMGMSLGAISALQAAGRWTTDRLGAEPFQAAVALYPTCESRTVPNAPILILVGDRDSWVNPQSCVRYLAKHGADHDVSLTLYPGVHHVFDVDGMTNWGLKYDPDAAEDAKSRIRAFLAKHLAKHLRE